jgi:hypothetical protein
MRCPKCGFISFDHVENCVKCKKEISGGTEVQGTTYKAAAPSFLRMTTEYNTVEESDPSTEIEFGGTDDGFEYSDPDLDVLVGGDDEIGLGDDTEDVISLEDPDLGAPGDDFQLETDDGGFDFEIEDEMGEQDSDLSLSLPDELSDISDLSPPRQGQAGAGDGMSLSLDDETGVSDDLDLDGLDLDLGLDIGDDGGSSEMGDDLSLSLDDIDLSAEDDSGLDGLDMSLDLGGLDESKSPAPKSEKSSGSLDDLFLSLD